LSSVSLPRLVHPGLAALRDGEEGQALLEYAMILGLVAVVCAAVLGALGTSVSNLLSSAASAF
jgi:Flp pilus assembly pilin Flp